jgi:hypothetical protein
MVRVEWHASGRPSKMKFMEYGQTLAPQSNWELVESLTNVPQLSSSLVCPTGPQQQQFLARPTPVGWNFATIHLHQWNSTFLVRVPPM